MRLTVDLINNSHSYLNPLKERELDLRGHRIPAIENLGVAGPQDSIDLTDNDIQVLGNFPLSPRIRTLLLGQNRITTIHPSLPNAIPNLRHLVLTANSLSELGDLDVLAKFPRLTHLVLMENPVAKHEHYRCWVLWHCPSVRFLDFQKIKDAERQRARDLFGSPDAPTALASQIMGAKSRTFNTLASATAAAAQDKGAGDAATAPSKLSRLKLKEKEKKLLQDMIKKATSLEEIIRLEKALNEGKLPPGFQYDEMEDV